MIDGKLSESEPGVDWIISRKHVWELSRSSAFEVGLEGNLKTEDNMSEDVVPRLGYESNAGALKIMERYQQATGSTIKLNKEKN